MENNNFLTKDKVAVIIENAPKGITPEQIVNGLVARGYKLEGLNDQQPTNEQQIANAPRSELTPQQKMERDTQNAASFIGGKELAQGIGQSIANAMGTQEDVAKAQEQSIGIQGQLLQQIKADKALGKDTSKLENALAQLNEHIAQSGQEVTQAGNVNNLTNKEVLGSALQLATTVAGGKVAGAVSKTVGTGTGILAGAGKGALSGAISGGALGASYGTAQGMKENKDLSGIVNEALSGGVGGAVGGGILGAVAGGVSGKIAQNKLDKKSFITDLVSPKATEDIKQQAIKEGRVSEAGLLKSAKILPSKRDEQLAEAVKDVVSDKNTVLENVNAINNKISEINTGVKDYVKQNKVPFNTNQLKSKLNSGKDELKLIFASDANAEKTYNAVVKEFMKHVESKDTAGLLKARQEVDRIPAIKKLLDSQGIGENVKKEVVLTVRGQANKYIAELLPKGNTFRNDLLQESRMIEAMGNIAEKNTGMIGQNKLQTLTKKYPILKAVAGGLAASAGLKAMD